MRVEARALTISMLLFGWGCGGEPVEDENDHSRSAALIAENALNPNALNPNALNPNALNPNALNPNALNPNALNPNALDPAALGAIEAPTGSLSRMLLRYIVGCAFTTSQSFSFTWTDAGGVHEETYWGVLGIAPAWETSPLDVGGKKMVTACLAARTNRYETSVVISSRSQKQPLRTSAGDAELAAYPVIEGAFWGNLFSAEPAVYACYHGPSVDHARSASRACAAGHLGTDPITGAAIVEPCGIIQIVGDCSTICTDLDAGGYYRKCDDAPGAASTTKNVITTALP